MSDEPRKPRAINLTQETSEPLKKTSSKSKVKPDTPKGNRKPRAVKKMIKVEMLPENAVLKEAEISDELEVLNPPNTLNEKKGVSWGGIAFGALSAILLFGLGLYFENLVQELLLRNEWLGWIALAVIAVFVIALFALAIKEFSSLLRQRKISNLRQSGDKAKEHDDLKLSKQVAEDISALLSKNPETAKGRSELAVHMESVVDGSDLIHLVERDLLGPVDKSARKIIMDSAKRVSIVTAVSPRAIVDIGFVLYENLRLIRRISEHYGGRPGKLGMWRLAKRVVTHLAATGAIAVGDGLVQQLLGQGLAAKLSARLGEGVINGLLTARVGIAAIDVCRPLSFDHEQRPGVNDFLSELVKFGSDKGK